LYFLGSRHGGGGEGGEVKFHMITVGGLLRYRLSKPDITIRRPIISCFCAQTWYCKDFDYLTGGGGRDVEGKVVVVVAVALEDDPATSDPSKQTLS
jgi:hypothetical protein